MKQLQYKNQLTHRNRLARLLWGIAYTLAFRPTPRWAMNGWRRAILRIFGAKVGVGCRIDPSARIWAPWNLDIGDYVGIGESVGLYTVDNIKIGSKVTISQRVFVCTASHDIAYLDRPLVHAPIVVCDHAWIAAEAMLHPGVTVGEGAVIAARAVLRGKAPAWTVWAGNPAREVGLRLITEDTSKGDE